MSMLRTVSKLVLLALVSAAQIGCVEFRPETGCTIEGDQSGPHGPPHAITIDARNDFHGPAERFRAASDSALTAYVTWDACRIYFGFTSEALGPDASPYTFLQLYLDIDPLGDEGSVHSRAASEAAPRPKLPFKADYLIEIRADGRMRAASDSSAEYRGNAQLYRRARKWTAGLIRHWEAAGIDALAIAHDPPRRFVEFSVERAALRAPCAVAATAWIIDTQAGHLLHAWPERGQAASDSALLRYFGFELLPESTPNAPDNLNRTAYHRVGSCAFGPEEEH